jgi:hypothetical protein
VHVKRVHAALLDPRSDQALRSRGSRHYWATSRRTEHEPSRSLSIATSRRAPRTSAR